MEPDYCDVRLLIFDLDGTLIDSKTDLALSVNAMRERMGLAPLPHETVASYVGGGMVLLVRRALSNGETMPVSDERVEQGVAIFKAYYWDHMLDNTVLYPGVREALEAVEDHDLAVLTNKPVRFSRTIMEGLGIASRFRFIYGGNSFEQKKPDPVGVHRLIADLSATPRTTMMIGDSGTDVLTGRNAGVWTAGVTYGYGPSDFRSTPPDVLLNDLRELAPALAGGGLTRESPAFP
jgi:phosphoglycolate phosphatase